MNNTSAQTRIKWQITCIYVVPNLRNCRFRVIGNTFANSAESKICCRIRENGSGLPKVWNAFSLLLIPRNRQKITWIKQVISWNLQLAYSAEWANFKLRHADTITQHNLKLKIKTYPTIYPTFVHYHESTRPSNYLADENSRRKYANDIVLTVVITSVLILSVFAE